MANSATIATTGVGQAIPNLNVKTAVVLFATTATGDILIFDTSNVGNDRAFSSIKWSVVCSIAGGIVATNTVASNQITIGTPIGATQMVAVVYGVGA